MIGEVRDEAHSSLALGGRLPLLALAEEIDESHV
jgi:hypothetical protein